MNKSYKSLYESAIKQVTDYKTDAIYWETRAKVAEGEISEIRNKLRESLTENHQLSNRLTETEAKVPSSSLHVDNENLKRINETYREVIFKKETSVNWWVRLRLVLQELMVKLKH